MSEVIALSGARTAVAMPRPLRRRPAWSAALVLVFVTAWPPTAIIDAGSTSARTEPSTASGPTAQDLWLGNLTFDDLVVGDKRPIS